MRAWAWLLALGISMLTNTATATVERFALIMTDNRGDPSQIELRHAGTDGARMYSALKDVGGFSPANMILLRDDSADVARRALISLNERIRIAMSRPGNEAMLFVFYSGHADATSLRMSGSAFDLGEVEALVRGSAATLRVLVVDACRSGSLTRVKGGQVVAPFPLTVDDSLHEEGVVFLTSSSANEDAQESDEVQGSFFTHFFVSGLLGAADADGDGRVQLDEAYRYAYDATLRATSRTFAGTQHPTYRYDLRGQGKVILTEPGQRQAGGTLVFPDGRSYLVTRAGPDGEVIGEVASTSPSRRLSVRPDRYFVRGRATSFYVEGIVAVSPNELFEVRDDLLQRFTYARLLRKGEDGGEAVRGVRAGYTMRTPLRDASSLCHGAFAEYAIRTSSFDFGMSLHGCASTFRNAALRAEANEAGATATLSHGWDAGRLTFDLGLSLGASLLYQRFETTRVAPNLTTFAAVSGLQAGVSFDLGSGVSLFAEERAETYLFELRSGVDAHRALTPSVAFRQLLGVGKDW